MKNLEVFESQTAEIFKLLYESFPVPIEIYFHEVTPNLKPVTGFGEEIQPPKLEDDFEDYYESFYQFEQSQEYTINSDVFPATVQWLKDSGYIKFDRFSNYHCFERVVLTAKGLEVLKCTPSCLDGSLSLGEKLQDEVVTTGSDMAKDLVKQALTEGLRLAIGV